MSYLKRLRNISVLFVIIFSMCLFFEQAKVINSMYSDNTIQSEQEKQTIDEPIDDINFEASSVVNITETSQWDENYGVGFQTLTYNQYSLILTQTQGIHVLDKTDPTNPFFVSSWINLSESHSYITFDIQGDLLYVLDTEGLIRIVDISDITNFVIVSITDVGYSNKLEIFDSLLFVLCVNQLKIYNISTPGTINFVESYTYHIDLLNELYDIEIINHTAYFIGNAGMQIYNITDLYNIEKIGNTTTILENHGNHRISIKNDFAFISSFDDGIVVYNITNQTNPTYIYNILNESIGFYYDDWYFIDDYLLVHNNYEELILCDATNLSDIFYIKSTELSNSISIEKHLDTLIITTDNKYLYIANISNLLNITMLGTFDIGGYSIGIDIQENFVYLANGASGLEIISITNPENPVRVANVFLESYADGVCVANDLAFVACFTDGVYIIDVSNPLEPLILSKYVSSLGYHYYYDLAVKENLLYIANGHAGVEIVDFSIASSPVLINDFNTGYSFAQSIYIQDDLAFIADGFYEFAIYDIGSPIHPTYISSVFSYEIGPREIIVKGDYAYVLNYYAGFAVIDIKKPYDPEIVLHYQTQYSYFRHIAVWGEYVYLSNSHEGLFVVDCFDMEAPVLIQRYDNSDPFFEIFAYNNYVYLANGYNGFVVFGANKTKQNGFEIPIVTFIFSIGFLTGYIYKKRKRKSN